jgi:hypothetical protein
MNDIHFNQPRRRKAEFMVPPNILKTKVGSGGLSEEILNKAQALLEEHTVEFTPLASVYLESLHEGIEIAKGHTAHDQIEPVIAKMLYPAMQLKANGAMFHYDLITDIAEKLIYFLEVIEEPDIEAVEIILAFYTTMKAIMQGKITGSGGEHGQSLLIALNNACLRYFDRNIEVEFRDS